MNSFKIQLTRFQYVVQLSQMFLIFELCSAMTKSSIFVITNRRLCLVLINGCFVSFTKSASLSRFQSRRLCLNFKIGGFVPPQKRRFSPAPLQMVWLFNSWVPWLWVFWDIGYFGLGCFGVGHFGFGYFGVEPLKTSDNVNLELITAC